MAFDGLSVHEESFDTFLGVVLVGNFDIVGGASVLAGGGEAFHVRGEAGIYGQAVQRGVDAQDMLGNIYEGPGGGTGEPAVFGFAEVPGILSGYHLGVNVGLCPVNLTDVFDVGRAGLFVYFKGPVAVADDGLADGDPGVVVAEDTGILFVSGRIGGDFAKVEVIGGVRRLLKDNAVFGIEALFYGAMAFSA